MEKWENAEETEIDKTEQEDIYLSFKDGDQVAPQTKTEHLIDYKCSAFFDISERIITIDTGNSAIHSQNDKIPATGFADRWQQQ